MPSDVPGKLRYYHKLQTDIEINMKMLAYSSKMQCHHNSDYLSSAWQPGKTLHLQHQLDSESPWLWLKCDTRVPASQGKSWDLTTSSNRLAPMNFNQKHVSIMYMQYYARMLSILVQKQLCFNCMWHKSIFLDMQTCPLLPLRLLIHAPALREHTVSPCEIIV